MPPPDEPLDWMGGIPAPDSGLQSAPQESLPLDSSGSHKSVFEFVDWHMNSGTHRHLTEKDLAAFDGHSPEDAAQLLAKANFEHGRRLIARSKTCGTAPKKE